MAVAYSPVDLPVLGASYELGRKLLDLLSLSDGVRCMWQYVDSTCTGGKFGLAAQPAEQTQQLSWLESGHRGYGFGRTYGVRNGRRSMAIVSGARPLVSYVGQVS